MEMLGLCAYCEAPTRESCRICGRAICPDHTIEGELLCVDCARGGVET